MDFWAWSAGDNTFRRSALDRCFQLQSDSSESSVARKGHVILREGLTDWNMRSDFLESCSTISQFVEGGLR